MKKISKFLSLLMVMAMLFTLVPISALAANDEAVAAATTDSDIRLVLITSEAATAASVESEQAVLENAVAPAVVAEQPVTDELIVPADVMPETPAIPEQLTTSDHDPAVVDSTTATYLCLTQNGVIIDVLAANTGDDYAYDTATNELTLNNFIGEKLDVKTAIVPFKLVLLGTNILKTDNAFAVKVEGDMNASGTGTLIAEGQATPDLMGGGINVVGNLVIDSGTYEVSAVGYGNSSSAVGILAGDNAEVMTMGNLTINGGNIDVTAYNSDYAGAFGLFAFGDLVINGGNLNVFTDAPVSYSRGIGAYDNLVVNGGVTTVKSIAENGDAGALFSYNKISINNGILDLCTHGAIAKALVAEGSIAISPIYGDVDLNASHLYLEPLSSKDFKKHYANSSNPKTGVDPTGTDAAVAGLALLLLIGLAYLVRTREVNA
ncbi:MAG: carbohydrate-binding domain-containing protein [Firmicutes bacterium]|nr:carbohydrate-binding domain-containing protein [Bacillota bacterium]